MPLDAAERDAVLSPSGTVPRQPPPDPGASRPRDAKGPTERRPFDSAVPGRRPANRVLPLHPDPADPLAAPAPLRHPAPRNAAAGATPGAAPHSGGRRLGALLQRGPGAAGGVLRLARRPGLPGPPADLPDRRRLHQPRAAPAGLPALPAAGGGAAPQPAVNRDRARRARRQAPGAG